MKLVSSFLLLSILAPFELHAQTEPAAGPEAVAAMPLETAREDVIPAALDPRAAYEFALAKLLLSEGDVRGALAGFDRAVEQEPDEPYLRLEYADLLSRLAQSQRTPEGREQQWNRAAVQVDAARRLAPDNLDVLSATGDIYLALADYRQDALGIAVGALKEVRERAPWETESLVALGQAYISLGDVDRAADVFEAAADYTPNSRVLYTFLADALTEAGRHERAEDALMEILELHPDDLETRIRIVDSRSRRGAHEAALELLAATPEAQRGTTRLRVLEARELFLADRSAEALDVLNALRGDAGDAGEVDEAFRFYVGNLRAAALADLGRDAEALDAYRELLTLDPENADVVRSMARHLRNLERRDEAIEVLAGFLSRNGAAVTDEPALEAVSLTLSLLYVEAEDWARAEQTARPLLGSTDPQNRQAAVLTVADALHRGGRTSRALDLLDRRGGDTPLVAGKRAELLLDAGREARALELLTSATEADSAAEVERALAVVQSFQAAERHRDVLPVLERITRDHPRELRAWYLLGAAAERSGDAERATAAFEHLLGLEPDHAPTLNYLGYMWAEADRNLDRALEMIERAVRLEPDNGAFADSLGWVKYRLGRHEEALEDLQRAARLLSGDPVVYDHLGDVYAALGEDRKAAESYRRALTLADGGDLDPAAVRRKLDRLETTGSPDS